LRGREEACYNAGTMMNERDFVTQKRETWEQLARLVEKAKGARGLRALDRAELQSLGPLYRRVATDLAYARARATSDDLVLHLNDLVGRAHALLYESESGGTRPGKALAEFYFYEFPALLQRYAGYFLAAVALCVAGVVFGYWLVINDPEKLGVFVPPQFQSSVEYWKSGKVDAPASAEFSAGLMTHNFQVGLISAASGVVVGLPTASMMFDNGGMVGAMAALMTQVQKHHTFWPGIVPHGVAELTAIFICGAAGFLLGTALLFPGPYSRLDALRLKGTDAIKLVLGTIPLFIFAGVIEGMFSRLAIPVWTRYGFAIITGILWYVYLFLPRRRFTVEK
jgi:uncharacterized membrane protein SpoIIM required for sporulation